MRRPPPRSPPSPCAHDGPRPGGPPAQS
jgi:hypothetical protein